MVSLCRSATPNRIFRTELDLAIFPLPKRNVIIIIIPSFFFIIIITINHHDFVISIADRGRTVAKSDAVVYGRVIGLSLERLRTASLIDFPPRCDY